MTSLSAAAPMFAAESCEASNKVMHALSDWDRSSGKTPIAERRAAIDALAAQYPTSYHVQADRIQFYRNDLLSEWPAVRDAYVQNGEEKSTDPLALTLAAEALISLHTSHSIEILDQALKVSPNYPWAELILAFIRSKGAFEDKAKAKAALAVAVEQCQGLLPWWADGVVSKAATPDMQAALAKALRTRLASETDPPKLLDYERLWTLEFHALPPTQHAELRKQIAKDVDRLEKMPVKSDSYWLALLLTGLKQSGASAETITAMEDRIVREAPESESAFAVVSERWEKEHKSPEDQKDKAAWDAWKKEQAHAMAGFATRFTDVGYLKGYSLQLSIEAGEVPEKEAIARMEADLQHQAAFSGPSSQSYASYAGVLLDRGWSAEKALEWTRAAWPLAVGEDADRFGDDTMTPEHRTMWLETFQTDEDGVDSPYLDALLRTAQKDVPGAMRAYIERPMPAKKSAQSGRYWRLAKLAEVDGRQADALAYFQQALFSREKSPEYREGKLEDKLLEQAKAEFLKTGGSEKVFALWSTPREKPTELAEGRWEKPTKPLPPVELTDLSGKTWKLTQLEGKAVLINLWATWCGPCQKELPQFQKLYEKVKDRPDVQVVSFNVDEEIGLVEPFLKKEGYTFPVLLAGHNVEWNAIPQNWVVDPKGQWIATQLGFDRSEPDWIGSMIKRLEDTRTDKPAGDMK